MYKKLRIVASVVFMLLTIVFTQTNCSRKTVNPEDENLYTCGGYSKERDVNQEDSTFFFDTYKGETALIPIKVSTQIVAGMNYKFICKDKDENQYVVHIYKRLECDGGNAEVTSVTKLK